MRLLGVGVTIRDPKQIRAQDWAYKNNLIKKIRKIYKYYGSEERGVADALMQNYMLGRDRGDNFAFNPRY